MAKTTTNAERLKYDKIMNRNDLDDIVERLKGYEAIVRAVSNAKGISTTMGDALWCMAIHLRYIIRDFEMAIAGAEDYLKGDAGIK